MKLCIDRIEGQYIVAEMPDGKTVELPRVLLPQAVEGDIISITLDTKEKIKRERAVEQLMNDLFLD